jgi:tripeptide aminopeptidase
MPAVNRERLLHTFERLLAIEAISREEKPMAEVLLAAMRELGATVRMDDAGVKLGGNVGNLVADLPGTVAAPALLFCAHLDTVQPTVGLQVQRSETHYTSDGTTILGADDRAGIAAMLEMLYTIRDSGMPHPPLQIVFTIAEEIGVMGSMVLDYELITAPYGFVPDTSGPVGRIITSAPAQQHIDVVVTGTAAHAGMCPEKGVCAITIAAKAIARMRLGRVDDETTANIGIIKGGQATNIVADRVEIEGEARSRDPQKLAAQVAHMRACLEEEAAAAGGAVEFRVVDTFPAFTLAPDSPTVRLATQAADAVGAPAVIMATGGGSDANFFNQHGIQAAIISTGYENAHTPAETQNIDELVKLAQMLVEIVALGAR